MGNEPSEDNGWGEWRRVVLSELKDLKEGQKEFRGDVEAIRVEMAILKTKAGVWGMIAGAIPVSIGLVVHWLTGKKP